MATDVRIFGLDGEMSGNDIFAGHKLIQIGVAVDTAPDGTALPAPQLFCSLIGWDASDLVWDERAAQVHNIPFDTVVAAPRADVVDAELEAWLLAHGAERSNATMCGFNVGAFDGPFVRAALPRSAALFSRRYADLNPLTMLLRSAPALLGGTTGRAGWKRHLSDAGRALVASTGRIEAEHDAGTDALLALGAWRKAEQIVATLDDEAAQARRARRAERIAAARAS